MVAHVNSMTMLAMSVIVLFIGMTLTRKLAFLEDNYIPPAVTGGLLFCLGTWALHAFADITVEFDMQLRDLLLLVFFSTVGLNARTRVLIAGGRTLIVMVLLAGVFLFLQNTIGILAAFIFDVRPGYGLMAGSVSFAGGHGTAAAWGTEAVAAGLDQAVEVGLIFATFGLIAGGVVGGPIARRLIERNGLQPTTDRGDQTPAGQHDRITRPLTIDDDPLFPVLRLLMILALCVSLGEIVNRLLMDYGLRLPGFLTAMFVAIALTNIFDAVGRPVTKRMAGNFGEVSLNIFLTMSMMSIHLWMLGTILTYAGLILAAQIALMLGFAIFVVFRLTGRDYDAAVMTAGFIGLGLGATPVALANMDAVTRHYGSSIKALIVIPIIGAFFIDLLNAGVINFFIAVLTRMQ